MSTVKIKLPDPLADLFTPKRGDLRIRAAYGGRGSGKSFSFALMAAVWGYAEPLRILCTRELQISIKESMHAEIKNAIESVPWLAAHYEIGEAFIRGKNGTEFIFRGLRHNISAVKSMAQIDLCIVEEAADVPEHSWQALLPTIRAPKSEIWAIWNPKNKTDPVDVMFRQNPPPRCMAVEMSWRDNPWFPSELDEQRQHAQSVMNPADYAWIWEGDYLVNSAAAVFSGRWERQDFNAESRWQGPYCGLDFGFAQDPTAAVVCWTSANTLYIEHEAGGVGMELDHTARAITEKIPDFDRRTIFADSARPESISYLKRHGMPNIRAVKKWPGSVEDGIAHIKSYQRIIVHPRCKNVIAELSSYSYKVDRHTGEVLSIIVDANNHWIDAIRYSLSELMRQKPPSIRKL